MMDVMFLDILIFCRWRPSKTTKDIRLNKPRVGVKTKAKAFIAKGFIVVRNEKTFWAKLDLLGLGSIDGSMDLLAESGGSAALPPITGLFTKPAYLN